MSPLFVLNTDPPGIIRASLPSPLADSPRWRTSDDSVVTITSIALDGSYCLVDWGRAGNAIITVTARLEDGSKWLGEFRVYVENAANVIEMTGELFPE